MIYGIAAAFFVYGILLMVEGFFTTGAIKDLYGDFKITTCGRCVSAWVCYLSMFGVYVGLFQQHTGVYIHLPRINVFLNMVTFIPMIAILNHNIIF